ncbi:hypothetical protein DL766_006164 [Monosporascus sp. MC13-8B]|uniref:Uncharacterized protein n=1 Tax=Monosporascus cannonballus TaxID=155416 RepID=A0ABY0HD58_9PEZI|nr:hypothetical protein DL762_002558 [Monosporascus cannonballus]RYO95203.1 hypothetical protein DL763_003771 [Monosporascus cannonballus]RYP27857.1 hypothetical protein DL766_006164 [Monosporascus sp. MC13-8B]
MSTSRIAELSSRIADSTAILNDSFVANHLPTLTSAQTQGLPDEQLGKQTFDHPTPSSSAARATFGEIAAISGLSETNVRQSIRHAMVRDIFQAPRSGAISHISVSRLLAEDPVIRDWVCASREGF